MTERLSYEQRKKNHEKIVKRHEDTIRQKGGTIPKKPTRVSIIESWVKLNKWMAKPERLAPNSPTYPDGLIKFEVKECKECQRVDIVQHQDTCVECMRDHAHTDALINEELKGTCGMCGKVLKEKERDPCARCCKMALGDNDEDRRENIESVIEHCKDIARTPHQEDLGLIKKIEESK